VCPTKLERKDVCNPRCVEIDQSKRSRTPGAIDNTGFVSYDCEVGFYNSNKSPVAVQATNDPFELSVCAWEDADNIDDVICGEYMFQLPAPEYVNNTGDNHQVALLIDKHEYENNDKIVVHVPTTHTADQYLVSIVFMGDNLTRNSIYNQTVDIPPQPGNIYRVVLDHQLPSGRYQVVVTPMRGGVPISEASYSSFLSRPNYGQHALGIITAVLVVILIVGIFLTVYKRWQQVAEEGAVEPSQLVETGRIDPKSVLIVTSLHNQDHVEVVKDLCRYLRDWCGVGKTYFAMDEETGIHSGTGQRDPWRWCQETGEVVRREDGVVVFIAGPHPAISATTSIHPNLEHNQAFLTTAHLRAMSDQGRVIVTKFSYSDMTTLPAEVPQHLADGAYHLPRQMNSFLCHLLQVQKKVLCSLIPLRVVRPEIIPHDLTKLGGPELQEKIRELCLKEHQYRLCQAEQRHSNPLDRLVWNRTRPVLQTNHQLSSKNREIEGCPSDSEDRPLYPAVANGATTGVHNNNDSLESNLSIEIEAGMPSTREMVNRDKNVTGDV